MKVLVTGVAGYLGSRLVHFLSEDKEIDEIIGVDNLRYKQSVILPGLLTTPKLKFHNIDILQNWNELQRHIHKSDIIIPLAALVGMGVCEDFPKEAEGVNLTCIKLLDKAMSANQVVVFPNTNSGYGTTDGNNLCTETTPMNPISVYGRTKCEAEKVILDAPYSVVFRLATVFGLSPRIRLDLLINDWLFKTYFYQWMKIYEPDYKRNFVHIDDVCKAFIWGYKNISKCYQEVFNLGYDKLNMSKIDIANVIKKHVKYDYEVVDDVKDPDQRNYIVSSDKLKKYGFEATIGLDETIPQILDFLKGLPIEVSDRMKATSIFFNR